MLVITRRVGEETVIDDEIHITILGVEGRRVRFGVTAPPSIRVDRAEVYERNCRALAEASIPSQSPLTGMR